MSPPLPAKPISVLNCGCHQFQSFFQSYTLVASVPFLLHLNNASLQNWFWSNHLFRLFQNDNLFRLIVVLKCAQRDKSNAATLNPLFPLFYYLFVSFPIFRPFLPIFISVVPFVFLSIFFFTLSFFHFCFPSFNFHVHYFVLIFGLFLPWLCFRSFFLILPFWPILWPISFYGMWYPHIFHCLVHFIPVLALVPFILCFPVLGYFILF